MEHELNLDRLPSALMSRDGWSDFLESRRPAEPHLHQIEPTNHCPYTCRMCPRTNLMTRSLGFMDLDLYHKVMEEVAGYSEPVRSMEIELFHFGESLLHPRIHEMVGIASSLGLKATLSVNAPHLTPERIDSILARDPFRLIISFDGYDRESYQRIRGRAADYDKAVRHIEYLASLLKSSDLSTRISIRMIRLYDNEPHLDTFRQRWESQGFEVEIRPFFAWSEKDLVELGEVEKYPPGMPCPFPWQYVVVQWDGSVVPCCRDYNAVNSLGNVRDTTLKEIWNSRSYADFRNQHRTGDYGSNSFCRECMDIYYTPLEVNGSARLPGCSHCRNVALHERRYPIMAADCSVDPEMGVTESPGGRIYLSKPQRIILYLLGRSCCMQSLRMRSGLEPREFDTAWTSLMERGIVAEGTTDCRTRHDAIAPFTLTELWDQAVDRGGDAPLLICEGDGTVFSYAEVRRIVEVLAARMAMAGVAAGDRVAANGMQSAEIFLVFWATVRLGAVFVPLDPKSSDRELASLLERISPRLVFAAYAQRGVLEAENVPEWVVVDDPPELESTSPLRLVNWMETGTAGGVSASNVDAGSPAVILFTSGTTGESKGVRISHGALARSAALVVRSYGWHADDVLFSLGDFHTMSGVRNPCVAAVQAGAGVVIAHREGRANARVIADTMSRYGVTLLTTVPAVLKQFVDSAGHLPGGAMTGLRQVLCTASHLNPRDADAFLRRFNIPVYNYYGLTETTGICAGVVPGQNNTPEGSIGLPLDSLMILDHPDGSRGDPRVPGELLIFSDNLMLDYLDDPERTSESFDSGFYRTGDLAFRDPKGWLFLIGRKGDAIKNVQGEFVHPRTIERALEAEDPVREAGVCGLNVGTEREQLAAAIVPGGPVKDAGEFLFALRRALLKNLGHHRLPTRMILVDALPRGTNGKLLRGELRKILEAKNGRERIADS